MLKVGISLDFMSDRPLGNLILSFLVISLWKTTINPFSSDIFMQKKKNSLCKPPHSQTTTSAVLPAVCTACTTRTSILQAALASLPVEIYSEPPRIGGGREGYGYLVDAGSSASFV